MSVLPISKLTYWSHTASMTPICELGNELYRDDMCIIKTLFGTTGCINISDQSQRLHSYIQLIT